MADDVVLCATSGPIATITLNRPDKANAIRADVAVLLDDALRTANRDSSVKVIVLEGAGDNFCAGFDFSGGLEHHRATADDRRHGLPTHPGRHEHGGPRPLLLRWPPHAQTKVVGRTALA